MEKVSKFKKIGEILRFRCPNCGTSKVFYKTAFPVVGVPKMKESCEHCGYHFQKEPGFYLGAMYVSYGLAVLEGLIAFLLARNLVFGLNDITLALVTICAILLCAMWNYRLSRVIWMNVFHKRDQPVL